MGKPKRTFSADVGNYSVGSAGPDQIEYDIDNLAAALDPDDTFKDGSLGGIVEENCRPCEIDPNQAPTGNTGTWQALIQGLANRVKAIMGTANWCSDPPTTITAIKTALSELSSAPDTVAQALAIHEADKTNPHQVTAAQAGALASVDGVSNAGGNVDLVAGNMMAITPDDTGKKITFAVTPEFVAGMIMLWSGSVGSIPSGWALCNGANGTPDLRDRFIVGAGGAYGVGATGGEATHVLTAAEIPGHKHNGTTAVSGAHTHDLSNVNPSGGGASVAVEGAASNTAWTSGHVSSAGAHTHAFTTDNGTGGGVAHENRPPFYALAYIMKL